MSARELDGYGRCPGCGTDFAACAGLYHCAYGCEEPAQPEPQEPKPMGPDLIIIDEAGPIPDRVWKAISKCLR